MKHGYLITAYDQPSQLARLVAALQTDGACFYIHIDRKFDLAPFRKAVECRFNVQFIRPMNVTWMGFSQVRSTLALMRAAVVARCDYYTLLSGSDYPVKSNSFIRDFFSRADTEFINFWKLEDRPSWLHKIQHYYAIDQVPILNYPSSIRRYFWNYFYNVRDYFPRRQFLKGWVPYGGCGWWSLSHGCLAYVLERVAKETALTNFYRFTHSPIELFFQTLILNSEWAARVQNYEAYQHWSRATSVASKAGEAMMLPEAEFNYRYIDWSSARTAGHGRPATLDDRDFPALQNTHNLFARKFDEKASSTLLELIDRKLR